MGTTEETCGTHPGYYDGYPSFRTLRVFCCDDIVVYTAANNIFSPFVCPAFYRSGHQHSRPLNTQPRCGPTLVPSKITEPMLSFHCNINCLRPQLLPCCVPRHSFRPSIIVCIARQILTPKVHVVYFTCPGMDDITGERGSEGDMGLGSVGRVVCALRLHRIYPTSITSCDRVSFTIMKGIYNYNLRR